MPTRRALLVELASLAALPLAAIGAASCGYRPLRGVVAGSPRLVVARADALVAGGRGVMLADEAAFGARAELAKYGALAGGGAPGGERAVDRLAVVVVRVEERSEGIELGEAGSARARGVRVRVSARGVVTAGGGGEPAWETPDLDATEVIATEGSSAAHAGARDEALRALARAVGARVARAVLGLP